ncbi:MAG: terminase [Ktedonobacterales bacterium]|nr:terminase [Ktedonobacterales bacterium]
MPHGETITIQYTPYGGARDLFGCRDRELLMEGPAGTGKSFAALWKAHLALLKYPGARWLLLRKTLVSLKASTLVTYREKVLHPALGVRFWAAKGDEPAHYAYPNGSKLIIGGMDKPGKIMSTEYDGVLWDEATDGTLDEWEALMTRLRYARMPYQQAIACANPSYPAHWLNERANSGRMTRVLSRHEDNPAVTPEYLAALDNLSGVRRARLYLGMWAAAEGTVYEDAWDAARNLVPRATISKRPDDLYGDCGIDPSWPRYLAVDFGYNNPFVCLWAAEDRDGRLWIYRELYQTKRLVEDHAAEIKRLSRWGALNGDPLPRLVICDHDAEDRATLERHLGLYTMPAHKSVSDGIQAVASALRPSGDDKPRLCILRDSLCERDASLADKHAPCSVVEEFDAYVWDRRANLKRGEAPVKEHDHGLDALRYLVAERMLVPSEVTYGSEPWY